MDYQQSSKTFNLSRPLSFSSVHTLSPSSWHREMASSSLDFSATQFIFAEQHCFVACWRSFYLNNLPYVNLWKTCCVFSQDVSPKSILPYYLHVPNPPQFPLIQCECSVFMFQKLKKREVESSILTPSNWSSSTNGAVHLYLTWLKLPSITECVVLVTTLLFPISTIKVECNGSCWSTSGPEIPKLAGFS